jgi:hypothetical protein
MDLKLEKEFMRIAFGASRITVVEETTEEISLPNVQSVVETEDVVQESEEIDDGITRCKVCKTENSIHWRFVDEDFGPLCNRCGLVKERNIRKTKPALEETTTEEIVTDVPELELIEEVSEAPEEVVVDVRLTCEWCDTDTTPQWRRKDDLRLCNACYMRDYRQRLKEESEASEEVETAVEVAVVEEPVVEEPVVEEPVVEEPVVEEPVVEEPVVEEPVVEEPVVEESIPRRVRRAKSSRNSRFKKFLGKFRRQDRLYTLSDLDLYEEDVDMIGLVNQDIDVSLEGIVDADESALRHAMGLNSEELEQILSQAREFIEGNRVFISKQPKAEKKPQVVDLDKMVDIDYLNILWPAFSEVRNGASYVNSAHIVNLIAVKNMDMTIMKGGVTNAAVKKEFAVNLYKTLDEIYTMLEKDDVKCFFDVAANNAPYRYDGILNLSEEWPKLSDVTKYLTES